MFPTVHEYEREEKNLDDSMHYVLEYINNCLGVENVPVGCPTLNIESVKGFLSHYYPKLIFGQYVSPSCAGISRFIITVLQRSDVGCGYVWVCDSGADFHTTWDITLFDSIESIPTTFFVKQIKRKVEVTQWGMARMYTDGVDRVKKVLELKEVLFMPGIKANIFSLQRIRCKGACSITFKGIPNPQGVIPILKRVGQHIATMKETTKARPTLVCTRLKVADSEEVRTKGEILGGEGVQMELLHGRLAHTSKSVMERLARDELATGLKEGIFGDFGMCRGCKMGRSSEKLRPRKDEQYRDKEPLELVHTDIAGPFSQKSASGKGYQYNLVIIDD